MNNFASRMSDKELRTLETAKDLFLRHGYRKVTMSDIAQASGISRPTLYSQFQSKEDILAAWVSMAIQQNKQDTQQLLKCRPELRDKLKGVFDIWIVKPCLAVIDSDNGKDLIHNGENYAPEALCKFYESFQQQLADVLRKSLTRKDGLKAGELGRILVLATRGLKTTSDNAADLSRLIDGLIAMTLAYVEHC